MKKILCLSVLCLAVFGPALWAIPSEINYQGTLKEKGLPASGNKSITFTLTSPDGQTAYSNSITVNTPVVNGLFSTKLNFQLLSGNTWESIIPYMKVNVEGQDLSPTEKISATVYATISSSVVAGAINPGSVAPGYGLVPSGTIIAFGGANAPAGWLMCDGSAHPPSAYPNLFAAIKTTWGGDGVSAFNLPDLRGRTVIGAGQGVGLSNRTLADTFGEESHALVGGELPSHTHPIPHRHTTPVGDNGLGLVLPTNGSWGEGSEFLTKGVYGVGVGVAVGSMPFLKTKNTDTPDSGAAAYSGSGGGHNNMQPSAVVNYIIKN